MYRGFNLTLDHTIFNKYLKIGKAIHEDQKANIEKRLDTFKDSKGNIIASNLIADWFPTIKADVFLSHSHKDENYVIALAGWLSSELNLSSFIDSCVWGYVDDLLYLVDQEYCYQPSTETYSYKLRNRSTSHVHMMVSTALTRVINNCESVFFINTPNSILVSDYVRGAITDSPWIYSEIAMTSLIKQRSPSEHRVITKSAFTIDSIRESAALVVEYDADLSHLTKLSTLDLLAWKALYQKSNKEENSLDFLYKYKSGS